MGADIVKHKVSCCLGRAAAVTLAKMDKVSELRRGCVALD